MYKLAVLPKIYFKYEYSTAFGSQHDKIHIEFCLNKILDKKKINFEILYSKKYFFKKNFLKYLNKFDGFLFIGIDNFSQKIINETLKKDIYIWSFNQIEWANKKDFLNNVDIIFEQSTRNLDKYNLNQKNIVYTPLAFQHNYKFIKNNEIKNKTDFDLVFIGTLDRSRRQTAKSHRLDILKGLLEKGLKIANFNGRGEKTVEKKLINQLKKYSNFKYINSFGNPLDYNIANFALNLPFHELGSTDNLNLDWGMSKDDLENQIWLVHWDTFRCIGAKSNMITYDCKELRDLGLNNSNCHFYKNNTKDINSLTNEIYNIVKSSQNKTIDKECWNSNTYFSRWDMINKKIINYIE